MWRRRGKVMRLRIRRCQSSGLVLAVRGAKCNWVCVSFLVVSWRKAFNSPQITINKTTENGKALAKVAVCNACSPSAKSKAIAITPMLKAQNKRCHTGVVSLPPEASISTTNAPESAEVTKNTNTISTATKLRTLAKGNCSKKANNAKEGSSRVASAMAHLSLTKTKSIAVSPKTVIHKKVKPVGKSVTPKINSRMLRPRDTRAINIPTKGDHDNHQPQYNRVQPPSQSVFS